MVDFDETKQGEASPIKMALDRKDIGCVDPEVGCECDSLAIIIASYFAGHEDRPDSDVTTESDDNCYWGDWVIARTDEAMESIAKQLNDLLENKRQRAARESLRALADE